MDEMIVNEEVVEMTEDIIDNSGKGLKTAAGVGLTVLGGFVAYKYVIKPVIAKIKSKKELKNMSEEVDDTIMDVVIEEQHTED